MKKKKMYYDVMNMLLLVSKESGLRSKHEIKTQQNKNKFIQKKPKQKLI